MNKPGLIKLAKKIQDELKKEHATFYDQSGSIGRRYARQDEIGTPACLTIDFDSLKNKDVTLRDRDTTNQIRVKINKLNEVMGNFLKGEKIEKLGKIIK